MTEGMELRIEISIQDYRQGGSGLRLSEQMTLQNSDFLELSGILGKFHDLLAAIKDSKERAGVAS